MARLVPLVGELPREWQTLGGRVDRVACWRSPKTVSRSGWRPWSRWYSSTSRSVSASIAAERRENNSTSSRRDGARARMPGLPRGPRSRYSQSSPSRAVIRSASTVSYRSDIATAALCSALESRVRQRPSGPWTRLAMHDMGVQVGVVLAGVPVVERGGDHAADVDLGAAVGADPGLRDVPLDDRDDLGDRVAVAGIQPLAGVVVGQRPQHADRLGRGEGAVEPGDRAAPVLVLGVDVRGLAEPLPGGRVLPVGEQPLHLRRGDERPGASHARRRGRPGRRRARCRAGCRARSSTGSSDVRRPAVVGGDRVEQVGVGVAGIPDASDITATPATFTRAPHDT